jgi:bacterioferritin-associated ferredoxin
MFVCLCTGATNHVVADVVAGGACTSNEVAKACGAGSDCGRCRRTVRAIIAAAAQVNAGAAHSIDRAIWAGRHAADASKPYRPVQTGTCDEARVTVQSAR